MQHVIMPRHLCLAVIIICQSLHSCENLWPDPELVLVGGAPSTLQPVLTGMQRGSLIASAVSSGPETEKLVSTDSVVYNGSIFFFLFILVWFRWYLLQWEMGNCESEGDGLCRNWSALNVLYSMVFLKRLVWGQLHIECPWDCPESFLACVCSETWEGLRMGWGRSYYAFL